MGESDEMPSNDLFLTILPVIQLGSSFGLTEQIFTLFPNRSFATEFFGDEVDGYILTFQNRTGHFTGSM